MATTAPPQTIPAPSGSGQQNSGTPKAAVADSAPTATSLISSPAGQVPHNAAGTASDEQLEADSPDGPAAIPVLFHRLPVGLSVSVPVREFRVRNLLAMASGEIIETQWGHEEDIPLASGEVQLAWTEFEVVDLRLAVRITRLA